MYKSLFLFQVDLIGYSGSDPPDQVKDNKNISIRYVPKVENLPNFLPKLLKYLLKAILQVTYLHLIKKGYDYM